MAQPRLPGHMRPTGTGRRKQAPAAGATFFEGASKADHSPRLADPYHVNSVDQEGVKCLGCVLAFAGLCTQVGWCASKSLAPAVSAQSTLAINLLDREEHSQRLSTTVRRELREAWGRGHYTEDLPELE